MNERGVALFELLIGAAIGSIVLIGVGSFYVSSLRFADASNSQMYLQRQGSMIIEEMRRQVLPATAPPGLSRGCNGGDPNSFGGTNGAGSFCFYKSGNTLIEAKTSGGVTSALDLLNGLPVPLYITSLTTSPAIPTTTISIVFELTDSLVAARPWRKNFMTFTTDVTRRSD